MSSRKDPSFELRIIESTVSTNADLLGQTLDQAPIGTALLARTQRGGKGRADRVWESPLGGMYLSVVLHPSDPRGLSLLGAAAAVALLQDYNLEARIRWPNDVTLHGKKIAGVLPVARYQGNVLEKAILGIGLNVHQPLDAFPSELRPRVTTLALAANQDFQVESVARSYLEHLQRELDLLEAEGLNALCRRCEGHLEGYHRRPVLTRDGQNQQTPLAAIAGLSDHGALKLRDGTLLESLAQDQRLRFEDEI